MDYTLALFLERIPGLTVKTVQVGGIEQKCFVIPIDSEVFHTAKSGKKFLQVTLKENDRPTTADSHYIYYSFPNPERKTDPSLGKYGRCRVAQDYSMNYDRKNESTFVGVGSICLDDIDEDAIYVNPATGKRYVSILLRPLAELDRGRNTHMIAVNPEKGADKGRRQSLCNGFDAPFVDIGRLKEFVPMGSTESSATDEDDGASLFGEEPDDEKTLGGYRF